MRAFAIIDEYNNDKQIGVLYYYEKLKSFCIEIDRKLTEKDAPILISTYVRRGQYIIDPEFSYLWVLNRIIPHDRQNIADILKDNGFSYYDEFNMLIMCNGRCAQDNCYLKEIKKEKLYTEREEEYPRVIDYIVLNNKKLALAFMTGEIKIVDVIKLMEGKSHFNAIKENIELFNMIKIAAGGYGIYWTDELYLDASLLYDKGINSVFSYSDLKNFIKERIINTNEACEILDCSRQNISDLVRREKLIPIKNEEKNTLFLKSDVSVRNWF